MFRCLDKKDKNFILIGIVEGYINSDKVVKFIRVLYLIILDFIFEIFVLN